MGQDGKAFAPIAHAAFLVGTGNYVCIYFFFAPFCFSDKNKST
jgi:hypothetical protein